MEASSSSLGDASPAAAAVSGVPLMPAHARSGSVLVLDKHIVYASLHYPLPTWLRRDVGPFVVATAALVAQALPALLYEAQVWWIRANEVEAEQVPDLGAGDASLLTEAAAVFDDDVTLGDLANSTLTAAANATETVAAMPTAAQLEIDALPVPDSIHFYFMYFLPLWGLSYAVLWLALYWSVKLQILFRYRDLPGIDAIRQATHVRVEPVEHGGKSEICKLRRVKAGSATSKAGEELFFVFQKSKYLYHAASAESLAVATAAAAAAAPSSAPRDVPAKAWFAPIDYPVSWPLASYLSAAASGGLSADALVDAQRQYGENAFDIPLPPFMDLFKEHALAPFFVFQILCVLLWCLDEYWYYSLMTLCMLVLFECTVVKRRLKNLEFLRDMRMKPYRVHVYRGKSWSLMLSSQLLPGDLVSIVRPKNEQHVVPADILLLTGSVVVNESMLTGESVPQIKENVESSCDASELAQRRLDMEHNEHKRNVLFGGTKVLLHNPPSAAAAASNSEAATSAAALAIKPPPDGGCVGFVLRTGFETSQGKLVRTILFASESVSINKGESLAFIGVLLCFALAASAYVCIKGLEDPNRSRYSLMLNCIMIITSVVPPELPMELSLAVNTSLLALMRCHIFCTEPFRIPLAGAVDVCAFDKTGTLTADEFMVKGIAGVKPEGTAGSAAAASGTKGDGAPSPLITSPDAVPLFVKYVIAGCHSLTYLPDAIVNSTAGTPAASAASASSSATASSATSGMDHLIGDPLEKSSLSFVNWSSRGESSSNRAPGQRERLRAVHKYPFSSALKRMSVVVALEHEPQAPLRVVTKGAAEVLQDMFLPETMPADYNQTHQYWSQQGCRVLALGYKELSSLRDCMEDRRALKALSRADIECKLTFAGFLILSCPLKKDSMEVIRHLKASSHQLMIITGDAALTGCAVAAELRVTTKTQLILQLNRSAAVGSELYWQRNSVAAADGSVVTLPFDMQYTAASLDALTDEYDLCISGDALDFLLHRVQADHKSAGANARWSVSERMATLARTVSVFARTSPDQKGLIMHWLKVAGLTTLMAGDGTNDSAALKQAHIGVALISEEAAKLMAPKKKGSGLLNAPKPPTRNSQVAQIKAAQSQAAGKTKMQQQLAEQLAKLESEMAEEENTTPRLGDASIAAPFTSKLPYITSCVDILRQGRCTLVTTLQMFNILGVNCLISAYSMSVLYLDGVKWGDTQMTIASMSVAMFFLFISRSQPLKQLSREKPHKDLFTPYMLLSVLGQFALHMLVLLTAINLANPHTPTSDEHRQPEKTFKPNVLNSVVFLVSNTQTVATFAANYRGRPFMESLSENKALYKSLILTLGLMFLLASESVPSLNRFLELHALPSVEFQSQLIGLLLFDVVSTYLYAHALKRIFALKPKEKKGEREAEAELAAAATATPSSSVAGLQKKVQ